MRVPEDIDTYSAFDLTKEVTEQMRGLGPRTDGILFVDVKTSDETPPELFFMPGKKITPMDLAFAHEVARTRYTEMPHDTSVAINLHEDNHYAVLINDQDFSNNWFGKKYSALSRLHALYHETGHALIPEGDDIDDLHPYREAAADAYAAIRLFQRFGQEAVPFLSMVSWARSLNALLGDTEHLTTMVIDKIITDNGSRDYAQLTAAETIETAREYAERWTPETEALKDARKFLFSEDRDDSLTLEDLLSSTCLSSSSHDLAFLVGAKVMQPLLQPAGLVCNGDLYQDPPEKRREYAAFIDKRLARMSLKGLFGGAAMHPSETTPLVLPVILPQGRKRLICNV